MKKIKSFLFAVGCFSLWSHAQNFNIETKYLHGLSTEGLAQPKVNLNCGEKFLDLAKINRSYSEIRVFVHPDRRDELMSHEDKIKTLLTSLALGTPRGRFKRLHNMGPNSYSMRLTKNDRLSFQIIEGDLKNGVRAIRVLSAKGHYDHLRREVKRSKGQRDEIYVWSKGN